MKLDSEIVRFVHDFLFSSLYKSLSEVTPVDQLQTSKELNQLNSVFDLLQKMIESNDGRFNQSALSLVDGERNFLELSDESDDFSRAENQRTDVPPLGYAVAQLHGVFILAQNDQGLVIVDTHAAHERITYERMKRALADDGLKTQTLLVPISIALSHTEVDYAEDNKTALLELGLEIERVSDEALVVRKVPALLRGSDIEQLVRDDFRFN